nr:hypothetical protein [Desulfovibrio sp. G11]
MIRFLLRGARIKRLGIGHFPDGQLIVIPGPTSGTPVHKAFFWLYIFGKICVPSHAVSGSSISACINRQKTRNSSFLPLRIRCQTAFGQLTHAVSGNALTCFNVALRIMESLSNAQLHIMMMPGGDIVRQPGVVIVLWGAGNTFADHNALILAFRLA